MKYVKQIGIILGVTLAGEALSHFLPFPVPAGVYGPFFNADSPDERDREAGKRRGDRKFSHGYHEHDVYSGYRRDY